MDSEFVMYVWANIFIKFTTGLTMGHFSTADKLCYYQSLLSKDCCCRCHHWHQHWHLASLWWLPPCDLSGVAGIKHAVSNAVNTTQHPRCALLPHRKAPKTSCALLFSACCTLHVEETHYQTDIH